MLPRRFALVRHVDYTGISGVGVVAYGVVFPDGQVALRWASEHPATSLWSCLDDMLAVHGHGEATSVEWLDPTIDPFEQHVTAPRGRRARRARPHSDTPVDPPPVPATDSISARDTASVPDRAPAPPPAPAEHDSRNGHDVEPARRRQSPPPPPARPVGSDSRVPAQRRPGRHRRAAVEQESESTLPIESDW